MPTSPEVIFDGAGHSGDSVMYIHSSSNVALKSLEIRNRDNINGSTNTYGSGTHFDGSGSLVLDTIWLRSNTALFGGGINFDGNGGYSGMTVIACRKLKLSRSRDLSLDCSRFVPPRLPSPQGDLF